jgi:hypothetical protein
VCCFLQNKRKKKESFVCDKIRGARVLCVVFYKIKGRRRRRKGEG